MSPSSRHRLWPASLPPLCQVDRDAIRQGQDRAMRLSAHLRAATRGACRHAECSDGSAQPTKTTTRSETNAARPSTRSPGCNWTGTATGSSGARRSAGRRACAAQPRRGRRAGRDLHRALQRQCRRGCPPHSGCAASAAASSAPTSPYRGRTVQHARAPAAWLWPINRAGRKAARRCILPIRLL